LPLGLGSLTQGLGLGLQDLIDPHDLAILSGKG